MSDHKRSGQERNEKQPLLERTKHWTVGIWFVFMLGFLGMCGMVTLIILFMLTLIFGDISAA